MVKVLVIKQ